MWAREEATARDRGAGGGVRPHEDAAGGLGAVGVRAGRGGPVVGGGGWFGGAAEPGGEVGHGCEGWCDGAGEVERLVGDIGRVSS